MSKIYKAFEKQKSTIQRIVAKYRSNPADIEELTQDVFLAAFAAEMRTEIHQPEHLLLRIAKNLAINEATKKINTTSDSIEDSVILSVFQDERQHTPEDIYDGRQKLFIFSQALASLSPDLRRAFLMRRVEKLKFKQIATRLNVSVSTVEKRVAAAMMQCHAYLKEHGHDPVDFGSAPSKPKMSTVVDIKNAKKE
jgi:RNA polymerase sigma-70 factor (ECF subfamily)